MEPDVLDKPVGPASELLFEEAVGMRLKRITDRVRDKSHGIPSSVQSPSEVHVFGQCPCRPAANRAKGRGAVHRKTPRADQRRAVLVLDLLVEGEGEEVLHVAPPFPDALDAARQNAAAGSGDVRVVERWQQLLDGAGRKGGVRVDSYGEFGLQLLQGEGLSSGLGARSGGRADDRDAQASRDFPRVVGRAIIHDDDLGWRHCLILQAPDGVGYRGGLVIGRDNDGYRDGPRRRNGERLARFAVSRPGVRGWPFARK